MDLDDLDCPQYVRFSSESFQDSLLNGNDSPIVKNDFLERKRVEGDLSGLESPEETLERNLSGLESSELSSTEDKFVVHTNTAKTKTSNVKKKATVPKPFKFETDNRLKSKNSQVDAESEKNFVAQLRQHDVPSSTVNGVTKVKPFNLTESKKRKIEDCYQPLAEQVQGFHKKTPDRYHSTINKEFQPQEHWSPRKLRPRTPKLQAVKRCRPVEVLSREQQELKELEEMKAYEFHARPVDPRVYKPVCIEKTQTRQTTKAKAIALNTEKRIESRTSKEEPVETYKFQARPVPKAILAGPVGLGKKPKVTKTTAKSPDFITEKRLAKRKLLEQETKPSPAKKQKVTKPKPQPPPVEPFKPKLTVIQPFSFDKIDQERFSQKERKIQEEIEKENKPYVFKAQLLPSPAPSVLPKVPKKPPTQPEPFNFHLECRSFKQSFTVQEESVSFKAHPATVLHKEPFIPEKPPKPLIEIKEFDLQTNRRASERLKQKELKDLQELEAERIRQIRKAEEEEIERQEILKLRQELVHKANPVRHFKPVEVKPSSKPITLPVSPEFETDKRLKSRHEN